MRADVHWQLGGAARSVACRLLQHRQPPDILHERGRGQRRARTSGDIMCGRWKAMEMCGREVPPTTA